jgi:hypothetical protein
MEWAGLVLDQLHLETVWQGHMIQETEEEVLFPNLVTKQLEERVEEDLL